MNEKIDYDFFACPQYFFDYGLQVFSHIEYDIIQYILRNTFGMKNQTEYYASIKTIALHRHYSEKNIIKAINNLIATTGIFNKVVYYEKGSCIKKTKYIITKNSIKILNDYVKKNMPTDFEEKKTKLKNRSIEAEQRLKEGREKLLEKQQGLLKSIDNENNISTDNQTELTDNKNLNFQLEAYKEIINDYNPDECRQDTFKEYKEYIYDCYLGYIPQETNDDRIDIKLSDLIPLTDNIKTIDFFKTLIKYKGMKGGQLKLFYDSLKIDFDIYNQNNFDRINVIFE